MLLSNFDEIPAIKQLLDLEKTQFTGEFLVKSQSKYWVFYLSIGWILYGTANSDERWQRRLFLHCPQLRGKDVVRNEREDGDNPVKSGTVHYDYSTVPTDQPKYGEGALSWRESAAVNIDHSRTKQITENTAADSLPEQFPAPDFTRFRSTATDADNSWEYQQLLSLFKLGEITREQAERIAFTSSAETLYEVLQVDTEVSYSHPKKFNGPLFKQFDPKELVLKIPKVVKLWESAKITGSSFDFAPVVGSASNTHQITTEFFQLMDGKNTIWDLAFITQQDIVKITREVLLAIEAGVAELVQIPEPVLSPLPPLPDALALPDAPTSKVNLQILGSPRETSPTSRDRPLNTTMECRDKTKEPRRETNAVMGEGSQLATGGERAALNKTINCGVSIDNSKRARMLPEENGAALDKTINCGVSTDNSKGLPHSLGINSRALSPPVANCDPLSHRLNSRSVPGGQETLLPKQKNDLSALKKNRPRPRSQVPTPSLRVAILSLLLLIGLGYFAWTFYKKISNEIDDHLPKLAQRIVTPTPESLRAATDIQLYNSIREVPRVPRGLFNYGGEPLFTSRSGVDLIGSITHALPQFQLRNVEPIDNLPGSQKGVAMLLNDELSFSQNAMPLTEEQYNQARVRGFDLQEVPVAIDAIVFFINPELKVPGLSVDQIQAIYTGKVTNWKQVGGPDMPIVLIANDPTNSATLSFLLANVGGTGNVRDVDIVEDYAAAASIVSNTLGAIGFTSASNFRLQPLGVRPLPIAKFNSRTYVSPYQKGQLNVAAILDGTYPLSHRIFVDIRRDGTPNEQAGVAYANILLSSVGQRLVQAAGFIPLH